MDDTQEERSEESKTPEQYSDEELEATLDSINRELNALLSLHVGQRNEARVQSLLSLLNQLRREKERRKRSTE